MAASPAPPTSTGADATAAPDATAMPGATAAPGSPPRRPTTAARSRPSASRSARWTAGRGDGLRVRWVRPRRHHDHRHRSTGSNVSLKTDDGWTRTIAVTADTKITKGGETITVGDLAVGDHVRIAQDRASDGTYTVTAIIVVLPSVAGQVSAIDGDTITITQPGGTKATIHVDAAPRTRSTARAGKLSDIKVGAFIVAEGTQRSDGSLDAAVVRGGVRRQGRSRRPELRQAGLPGTARRWCGPEGQPRPVEQRKLRGRRCDTIDRGAQGLGARAAADSQVVLTVPAFDGEDPDDTSRSTARSEHPMFDHDSGTTPEPLTPASTEPVVPGSTAPTPSPPPTSEPADDAATQRTYRPTYSAASFYEPAPATGPLPRPPTSRRRRRAAAPAGSGPRPPRRTDRAGWRHRRRGVLSAVLAAGGTAALVTGPLGADASRPPPARRRAR